MNKTFLAYQVEKKGDSFLGKVIERSISDLPEGSLTVKVFYSSLNYKDALSASGGKGVTRNYPHTPGIDAVGEVVDCLVEDWTIQAKRRKKITLVLMEKDRIVRINDNLKKEIATFIQNSQLKDNLGFLSVNHVDTSRDLSIAKVFISTFQSEKSKSELIEFLNENSWKIRKELARILPLKKVPNLKSNYFKGTDVIFSVGYMKIINSKLIDKYTIINLQYQ